MLPWLARQMRWIGAARTPASAVLHAFLSRVSILVINVATGIIVARSLGPEGRGIAAAITLWPFVISGLLTLGVPAALRYEIPRQKERMGELFSCAIVLSGALGALAFTIGFLLVPHVLAHYPPTVIAFAQLMMVFAPSMLWIEVLQAFYESRGDFKRASATVYIPPVATLVLLLVLQTLHRLSPFTVPIAYELPFACMAVVTIVQLRAFLRVPREIGARIRSLVHYGVRAYGIDILTTLAGRIDQAMVVGLLSSASFGLYVVAISGSRIPGVLGTALNTVLFPTASGLAKERAIALVTRSARAVFACTALAAAAFMLILPVIVPLVYGKDFSPVIGLTQLLTVAVVFGTTTGTFNQAFMATGRPEVATLLQCLGLCITVPLLYLLIPRFGLTGAALAVDVSYALRLVFVVVCFPLFLGERLPGFLPTRQDLRELFGRFRHVPTA
jgi:O-antigen/teichoic acid export membrane protein